MTRYVCSKMFTDVNIKFPYDGIKNCCKSNDYEISGDELEQLDREGKNIFTHNTEYMRRKREMLINNRLPENGCDTCIHAEPNSLFRTWNTWTNKDINAELLLNEAHFTTYEFVLSSACDLKCVYCAPKDSTSWAKELGVPINRGREEWKQKLLNSLLQHLRTRKYETGEVYWFFFSGGEPTYNAETLPLIEQIIDIVPNPSIVISTNANTKSKILDRYIEAIQQHPGVVWTFDCSIDDVCTRAEAIRTGMDWEMTIYNMLRLSSEPNVRMRISPTVNMYSIPKMYEFVTYFHQFFEQNGKAHKGMFNMNMVQEPELSPWSMPVEYAECLDTSIAYCNEHRLNFGSHLQNVQKLIGTKIDEHTADHIERKWQYFKTRRPEIQWEHLFPHVPIIIEELKNENFNIRK